MRKLINGKNATRFPLWREGGPSDPRWMVESRIHYVGIIGKHVVVLGLL